MHIFNYIIYFLLKLRFNDHSSILKCFLFIFRCKKHVKACGYITGIMVTGAGSVQRGRQLGTPQSNSAVRLYLANYVKSSRDRGVT